MHKKIILLIICFAYATSNFAQSIIANDSNGAALDIHSTTTGILIPKMNTAKMYAISDPMPGLLIYNTEQQSFNYYADGDWQKLRSNLNTNWQKYYDTILYANIKALGIKKFNPNDCAKLEIGDSTKGLLIPRVTSAQRNAITNAADGLWLYDTDENIFYYYTPGGWAALGIMNTNYWLQNTSNNISNITNIGASYIGIAIPDFGPQTSPQYYLDIGGRINLKQDIQNGATSGLWLDSLTQQNTNFFIGTKDNQTAGIWSNKKGWGLQMNVNNNNIGINTNAIQNNTILELSDSQKAFLPPRMSYAQMAQIPNPQYGMIAYDIDGKALRIYNGYKWVRLNSKKDALVGNGISTNIGGLSNQSSFVCQGDKVVTDASGNIYVAGTFEDYFTGMGLVAPDISFGLADIFLVKYNSTGVVQWATTVGSAYNDTCVGLEISSDGHLYLVGKFSGICSFPLGTATAQGTSDYFVSKWSAASGAQLWYLTLGSSTSYENINDILLDNNNELYLSGSVYNNFYASTGPQTFYCPGIENGFIVKINASGGIAFLHQLYTNYNSNASYIEKDQNNNIYVTGNTYANVAFGGKLLFEPLRARMRVSVFIPRSSRYRGRIRRGVRRITVMRRPSRDFHYFARMQTNGTVDYLRKTTAISEFKGYNSGVYAFRDNCFVKLNDMAVEQSRIPANTALGISRKNTLIASNGDLIFLTYAEIGASINFSPLAADADNYVLVRVTPAGNVVWAQPIKNVGKLTATQLTGNTSTNTYYITGSYNGEIQFSNGIFSSNVPNLFVWKLQL